MARGFLYAVAIAVVLVIAALFAMRFWARELTNLAFVPHAAFRAPGPLPSDAYASQAMWIARPDIAEAADPARWLPRGVAAGKHVPAAVFFVHPTSFLARGSWNAAVGDATAAARADMFVRGLASPFNAGAVWAPRYRQATVGAFLTDKPQARAAIDAAYGDVLAAFDHFIASVPAQTPIVLVGHSQGGAHILRLLADRVAGRPLAARVVAAYVVGWPVSLTHDLPATGLVACTAPDQTGCVLSWQSYAEPADTAQVFETYARFAGLDGRSRVGSAFLCTNPLTGRAGDAASAGANLGTLVPDAGMTSASLVPGVVPARCDNGVLLIGPGPDLGRYVLPGNNYHVYDIPLFWANVRADFARRVGAWTARH